MVEHEICELTSALDHIGQVNNIVNSEVNLQCISRSSLSTMHLFSVTSANIAINDISLKPDSLDYIFIADSIGLS